MKTIIKKIIIVVITTLIVVSIIQPQAQAIEVKNFDEMKNAIDTWKGKAGDAGVSTSDLGSIVMPVANILITIGIFVLVGVTIIMGIKYMFATPEEAAKLKQQLIGLVVSSVVIIGAKAIWTIVLNLLQDNL